MKMVSGEAYLSSYVRSRKHETWEKITEDGVILQVRLSHKGHRDIPMGTFSENLRQVGLDKKSFASLLR